MLTVFVFVMNVFSLPGVILICCSEFYFAVTVVGHRTSQVITLGEKEEELAKAKFQCKLVVGALLTFLPTFSLHNHLLKSTSVIYS